MDKAARPNVVGGIASRYHIPEKKVEEAIWNSYLKTRKEKQAMDKIEKETRIKLLDVLRKKITIWTMGRHLYTTMSESVRKRKARYEGLGVNFEFLFNPVVEGPFRGDIINDGDIGLVAVAETVGSTATKKVRVMGEEVEVPVLSVINLPIALHEGGHSFGKEEEIEELLRRGMSLHEIFKELEKRKAYSYPDREKLIELLRAYHRKSREKATNRKESKKKLREMGEMEKKLREMDETVKVKKDFLNSAIGELEADDFMIKKLESMLFTEEGKEELERVRKRVKVVTEDGTLSPLTKPEITALVKYCVDYHAVARRCKNSLITIIYSSFMEEWREREARGEIGKGENQLGEFIERALPLAYPEEYKKNPELREQAINNLTLIFKYYEGRKLDDDYLFYHMHGIFAPYGVKFLEKCRARERVSDLGGRRDKADDSLSIPKERREVLVLRCWGDESISSLFKALAFVRFWNAPSSPSPLDATLPGEVGLDIYNRIKRR